APARAWREARSGERLVLAESVLRRPAEVRDIDRGALQAKRGGGQPAVGGAWIEAAVVGTGWPAVAVQREQHDRLAVAAGAFIGHGGHLQVFVGSGSVPLVGDRE